MQRLACRTKQLLEEKRWTYRDQQPHTGVPASLVSDIVNQRRVERHWIRRFAFAAQGQTRDVEGQQFWKDLADRLQDQDLPVRIEPGNAHLLFAPSQQEVLQVVALYQDLRMPETQQAALRLLRTLLADEGTAAPEPVDRELHVAGRSGL